MNNIDTLFIGGRGSFLRDVCDTHRTDTSHPPYSEGGTRRSNQGARVTDSLLLTIPLNPPTLPGPVSIDHKSNYTSSSKIKTKQ